MLDQTDKRILSLLTENSRMQLQEIGEEVHLTGQAVGNRIRRLEKLGVIEKYTVKINASKAGGEFTAFITVFMKTNDHEAFRRFAAHSTYITELHKISGEGCYLFKATASSQNEIAGLLDEVLKFGNYKVNLSIEQIK